MHLTRHRTSRMLAIVLTITTNRSNASPRQPKRKASVSRIPCKKEPMKAKILPRERIRRRKRPAAVARRKLQEESAAHQISSSISRSTAMMNSRTHSKLPRQAPQVATRTATGVAAVSTDSTPSVKSMNMKRKRRKRRRASGKVSWTASYPTMEEASAQMTRSRWTLSTAPGKTACLRKCT